MPFLFSVVAFVLRVLSLLLLLLLLYVCSCLYTFFIISDNGSDADDVLLSVLVLLLFALFHYDK